MPKLLVWLGPNAALVGTWVAAIILTCVLASAHGCAEVGFAY